MTSAPPDNVPTPPSPTDFMPAPEFRVYMTKSDPLIDPSFESYLLDTIIGAPGHCRAYTACNICSFTDLANTSLYNLILQSRRTDEYLCGREKLNYGSFIDDLLIMIYWSIYHQLPFHHYTFNIHDALTSTNTYILLGDYIQSKFETRLPLHKLNPHCLHRFLPSQKVTDINTLLEYNESLSTALTTSPHNTVHSPTQMTSSQSIIIPPLSPRRLSPIVSPSSDNPTTFTNSINTVNAQPHNVELSPTSSKRNHNTTTPIIHTTSAPSGASSVNTATANEFEHGFDEGYEAACDHFNGPPPDYQTADATISTFTGNTTACYDYAYDSTPDHDGYDDDNYGDDCEYDDGGYDDIDPEPPPY